MDWLTPIHAAALKGRTDVLRELVVGACPESVHATTGRGETALHLAVRSSSFEAVEFLVETVAAAAELLNSKDDKGNTALHLAVARRQLQQTVGGRELRQPEGPDTLGRPARVPKRAVRGHGAGRDDPCSGRQDRCRTEASSASSSTTSPSQSTPKAACQARRVPGHPRHAHGGGHADSNHHVPGGAESPRRVHSDDGKSHSSVSKVAAAASDDDDQRPGKVVLGKELKYFLMFDVFGLFASLSIILLLICVSPRRKRMMGFLVDNVGRGAVHRAGLPVRGRADIQEQRRRPQPVPPGPASCVASVWICFRFAVFLLKRVGWWKGRRHGHAGSGGLLVVKRIGVVAALLLAAGATLFLIFFLSPSPPPPPQYII
ncbi:ankyrin repeat-containing protein-like [Iris pallida]|uniref:Ankyrin repeat-containing protein-like n=1 Tax=Iris pallida TaxID=29817 RepID=A0AAX6G775_IRIPA|nr:ankyrin repeat-containing protein-like [Iris pallida]